MINQTYNQCLKDIQHALGISTRLHSHLGRHTFATWMHLNGSPIEHVAKMLGHRNIQQTMRYAKVVPTQIYEDFDKFEKKDERKRESLTAPLFFLIVFIVADISYKCVLAAVACRSQNLVARDIPQGVDGGE